MVIETAHPWKVLPREVWQIQLDLVRRVALKNRLSAVGQVAVVDRSVTEGVARAAIVVLAGLGGS